MKISSVLNDLIKITLENKASDLHISSGHRPIMRVGGQLVDVEGYKKMVGSDIFDMLESIMTEKQKDEYLKNMELDFAITSNFDSRFRVNAFNSINGPVAVLRQIPSENITLSQILAPPVLLELCKLSQGLILVVGPTGSGKSTTLSAMINSINQNYRKHIITIEDPVEFIYESSSSLINQREIGSSSHSFPVALRAALREDPDVILVGEMRDLETIQLALTAAETGHLVMATLHTSSASQSINRIIDAFPSSDKSLIRSMLSSSLKAVISQRLVKKINGGRVAVYEIMIVNNSIRNLIREDKIPQINSMIEMGQKHGMVSIKNSLIDLFNRKLIDQETAESFNTINE